MALSRLPTFLSGLWAGLLVTIGGVGAPAAFAIAAPGTAGRIAGRMFAQEAYLSLVFATLLFLLLRKQVRAGPGSVFNANLLLVLAALFCTVSGYFALQPMLAAAKAGQETGLSFAMLHGMSAGLYVLKAALVWVLAWRLTACRSTGTEAVSPRLSS